MMSGGSVGFGRSFPRIWLLPILGMVALLGMAVAGSLSRALLADLVAWWPAWFVLILAAVLLRHARLGPIRVAGLVPLVATVAVALFALGHTAGWALMPSAVQGVDGPPLGEVVESRLTVAVDGEIRIVPTTDELYWVDPIVKGGKVGVPVVTESTAGQEATVQVAEDPASGVFQYAGWTIGLNSTSVWSFELNAAVDADLSGFAVKEAEFGGSGRVVLGVPDGPSTIAVNGVFTVVVPESVPARVIGAASVPAAWRLVEEGAVAPVEGEGWRIVSQGDSVLTVVNG